MKATHSFSSSPASLRNTFFIAITLVAHFSGNGVAAYAQDSADELRPSFAAPTRQTNQFIVKFKDVSAGMGSNMFAQAKLQRLQAWAAEGIIVEQELSGGTVLIRQNGTAKTVQGLQAGAPEIEYVIADEVRDIADAQITPDDPQFAQQVYLSANTTDAKMGATNVQAAWAMMTGTSDVVVAVVDTGVRLDHPDLAGRLLPGYDFVSIPAIGNDGDGRDDDASDPGDWISAEDLATPELRGCPKTDSRWHGTHVAGIIGANGNNKVGIAGVNWNSKLLPVRVMGKCGGSDSDIMDGIRWAAGLPVPNVPQNQNPARVINLSLGGFGACNTAMQSAINDAVGAGAVVVVAAGNANANAGVFMPANCSNVIVVGSTSLGGNRASYSNFGKLLTVSAPGGDTRSDKSDSVLSTVDIGTTTPVAAGYKAYDGTSMAAAEVSGIVSLIASIKPNITFQQVKFTLRASATQYPSTSTCNVELCGAGVVNAGAAVQMAQGANFTTLIFASVLKGGSANPNAEIKITNGDFEQGNVFWQTGSSLGLNNLILSSDKLPSTVSPRSGTWLAWLGGMNDEVSYLSANIAVPNTAPYLSLWQRVKSTEPTCGNDLAKIYVNEVALATIQLCSSTNIKEWLNKKLDLRSYAGQSIRLKVEVSTNASSASSLYLDDLSFLPE